jgi:hypothetical protein
MPRPTCILWALLAAAVLPGALPCYIQGVDSGVCKQPADFAASMPFCANVVRYPACVPKEYAWFPNHTLAKKDGWARKTFTDVIRRRIQIESKNLPEDLSEFNRTVLGRRPGEERLNQRTAHVPTPFSPLRADPYWEGGDENMVERFTDNADCQAAYKNFLCFMNFPRCDEAGQSLILCRSVCLNFFRACKYASFLNRCYNPEYYGAQEPEPEDLTDALGLPIYMRAHLPGQPFRDMLVDEESEEVLVVCTPSIQGGAMATAGWSARAAGIVLAAAVVAAVGRADRE